MSANSSSKEEPETAKTENNSLSNTDSSSESFSSLKDDQSTIRGKDIEEKGKDPEKKSKKHKDKSQKKDSHHFSESSADNISNFSDFPQNAKTQSSPEKKSDDEQNEPHQNHPSRSPKKPPPSAHPPPPPSKKPPTTACPQPPPFKKPPPSSFPPPPPSKKPSSSSSKKPPPSAFPPPPPSKKPPSSACPPPPPPKKPPPSSKPPPPPKQKKASASTNDEKKSITNLPQSSSSSTTTPASEELEENIPLSKSGRNNEEGDKKFQHFRMRYVRSKTISGNDNYNHRRYVPVDAPKSTASIEDVLSRSSTFLIPQNPDRSKELSEQEIIQSYFLKKNGSKVRDDDDNQTDNSGNKKNARKSRRIRVVKNSSYSNSLFSSLVDSNELQNAAEQSLKEYNDSLDKETQGGELSDELKKSKNENEDLCKKSDDSLPRPKLSSALSDPENLEKLVEINKKAKKILYKRFKKMLENYISEVEINSDFIELDTSRDSAIHWRKDPHLIKTNELRVESRELENKIASIRMENKDLQKRITGLYQTIGSKNQELMALQNEISRLKGSSDF